MTYKGVDINFYRTILDNSLFVTSMSDVKKPTWIELFFWNGDYHRPIFLSCNVVTYAYTDSP